MQRQRFQRLERFSKSKKIFLFSKRAWPHWKKTCNNEEKRIVFHAAHFITLISLIYLFIARNMKRNESYNKKTRQATRGIVNFYSAGVVTRYNRRTGPGQQSISQFSSSRYETR
jgi:hypothetical protein